MKAYYTNSNGASVIRAVTPQEAIDILERGRFGAKEARIETDCGEIVGCREKNDGRFDGLRLGEWWWFYDRELLQGCR